MPETDNCPNWQWVWQPDKPESHITVVDLTPSPEPFRGTLAL